MTQTYIGVDLSKHRLDICDPRRGTLVIENCRAALSAWIEKLDAQDILIFEATSGCDRDLLAVAEAAGQATVRLNPGFAFHFARSLNLPKTDRVDAAMLARYGQERQPEPDPPRAPARLDLAALVKRRDQLRRMEVQEKNRLAEVEHPVAEASLRRSLAALADETAVLDRAIKEHLAASPGLAEDAARLTSIPGIGPVSAAILLAHLPELGQVAPRAAASLAGLAPRARESGMWKGRRRLGPGRRQIRRVLYMAAMSAIRANGALKPFATRLAQRGKPGKVIICAAARKLVVTANALLRDRVSYRAA